MLSVGQLTGSVRQEEQHASSGREHCSPSNTVILQGWGFFFAIEKYCSMGLSGVSKIAC